MEFLRPFLGVLKHFGGRPKNQIAGVPRQSRGALAFDVDEGVRCMMSRPEPFRIGGQGDLVIQAKRHAQDIMKMKRRMVGLYSKHCKRGLEEVERTLDRDFFLTAEEAKDWGLVDHVYEVRMGQAAT